MDGGVFCGEWKGKEGLGTCTYLSGATYSGQWRKNTKGSGVYTFTDGGAYEGEWSNRPQEDICT